VTARDEPDEETVTEPVEVAQLPPDEARLMAGRLRADGIPATVYPQEVGTITQAYGLIRLVSVLVPKQFAEEARQAVRAITDS
jgi:hypothetical protein